MSSGDETTAPRRLMRRLGSASLGTLIDGAPYASLVLSACATDASPLLLLSDLAQHTRNIKVDDRVSLLFDGTGGLADPLTGTRLTVLGGRRAATSRGRWIAISPATRRRRATPASATSISTA